MMGDKICFYGEIWLIISKLSLLPLLIWSSDYYWMIRWLGDLLSFQKYFRHIAIIARI